MLMVMPRSFSSGALSMLSYARNSPFPSREATLVIAAVSVVLPWSMCPMVPTFKCGLLPSDLQSDPVGHLGTCPTPPRPPRKRKPTTGIEPITYRLQGGCSAVELRRHVHMLKKSRALPRPSAQDYTKGNSFTSSCFGERQVYPGWLGESIEVL